MKSLKRYLLMVIGLCGAVLGSCSQYKQYEDYHLTGVADLTLTEFNHPHGYTQRECFLCHLPQNIHKQNLINAPNFDLADPLVKQSGLASCAGCHGTNGVTP